MVNESMTNWKVTHKLRKFLGSINTRDIGEGCRVTVDPPLYKLSMKLFLCLRRKGQLSRNVLLWLKTTRLSSDGDDGGDMIFCDYYLLADKRKYPLSDQYHHLFYWGPTGGSIRPDHVIAWQGNHRGVAGVQTTGHWPQFIRMYNERICKNCLCTSEL